MKEYIIVTPCKNEQDNILQLAGSIINQTTKPRLWVIVDDGSTDSTPEILKKLTDEHSWIYVDKLGLAKRDLGFHYSQVVNNGFNVALSICKENKISYDYMGLIDADMILPDDFFEQIIDRLSNNPNLGIASGTAVSHKGNTILEGGRDNLPNGGLRVWRAKCFWDTGGFPISYSADSVSNVLAILKGWDTVKFNDIVGIQTRETSSAEGLWKGFKTRGQSDYYRDYHPVYIFFKFLKYTCNSKVYLGIPYLCGYMQGVFKIKTKIEIPEVRKYYRNKHKEIIDYYGKKFKFNQ